MEGWGSVVGGRSHQGGLKLLEAARIRPGQVRMCTEPEDTKLLRATHMYRKPFRDMSSASRCTMARNICQLLSA